MTGCTCGKVRYGTRREARRAGREIRGRGVSAGLRLRAYGCGGFWHLTSASARDTVFLRRWAS